MRKILSAIFILFIFQYSIGQIVPQWVSNYGGNVNFNYTVNDMVADKMGNVFLCGTKSDSTYAVGVVIKYNSAGIQQWIDTSNMMGNYGKIVIDKMGNVYIIGNILGLSSSSDYLTRKYNSSGVIQWTSIYNGVGDITDIPHAIVVDDSLNVYVTGEAMESSSYETAYSTVKYNSSGVQQWVAKYGVGTGVMDRAYGLTVDSLQNVYVTGGSYDTLNGTVLTIKYDRYGNETWKKRYFGDIFSSGQFIDISKDGFVYVGGEDAYPGSSDYLAIKYDVSGNQIWATKYDAQVSLSYTGWDIPKDMKVDDLGNVYITGTQFQGSGDYDDYCTIKINKSGVLKWVRSYNGGTGWDDATGISVDQLGNVYVVGQSDDNSLDGRILATIKYDSIGNTLWVAKYLSSSVYDNFYSTEIGLDSLNNVYVSGSCNGAATFRFITLKYDRTTAINELVNKNSEINIYPNPTTNQITIEFEISDVKNVLIVLKNTLGQPVKIINTNTLSVGKNKIEVDLNEFSAGLYFLQIQNANRTITKKIIKE